MCNSLNAQGKACGEMDGEGLTAPSLLLTKRLPMFSMPMSFTNSRTLSSYTRACTQQSQLGRLHKDMLAGQAHASLQC